MPIYEYHCYDCGKDFQTFVSHASIIPDCPICDHNREVEKNDDIILGGSFKI